MPLLPISLGLILGIFLSFISGGNATAAGLTITSLLAFVILLLIFHQLFKINSFPKIIPVIAFSLSFVLIGFCNLELQKESLSDPNELTGCVNFGTVFKTKISESGYQTIHLSLEKSINRSIQVAARGNMILTLDTLNGIYRTGDFIAFKTRIDPFQNETNPGSFDAEYYYGTHRYIGRAFITSNCIMKTGSRENLTIFLSKWQDEIGQKMKSWLPESVAGIGVALLLGNKADIDPEIMDSFSNTGAMHVLAVSGLHVGIILLVFQYIFGFFSRWISKKQAVVFSVILIWGFGLLSGASPSVIRAVVMFSILALGQILSRKNNGMNNLILSAILLLMYDPYYLFDVGFQLSYVALTGILLFQRPIYKLIHIKYKWLDWLWKGSAVGIAATIATTPFMLYWFHQFPNYFLLSNIVVMLFGFIVLLLLIVLVFTAWIPYFNALIIFLTAFSLEALITGIQAVDKIPGGVSGGFELNFFQFLLIGTLIGYCFHKLLIKQTLPKVALTAMAVCLMFISWKREAKFEKNEFQVFSAKTFCGMIQYNGKLITFTEDSSGNRQVLQIFKNAVRNAGLNPEKSIILKSRNKLLLNGKQICFLKENNGWKFKIGEQEFNYLSKGTPGKDHPKELLSQRLQYYLYREEKIKPFRIAI
ncbi:ComEC/Rec2 family competence protein [Fluviicola chungangensis]|uniref:ComEC/Rec2 family competence protein n=1 Tax=Fluviicola chungangensis TaxID=2597671 RepID=A0A556MY62_9FLAO|nr:ComEC/Rec2 family competence protein [Fluviicola chungangensis]TSJ44857.1 ComEC/Rec2 family competence protein [Fluviicola chungangensis]